MRLVAQLSPDWRVMQDSYRGKFHCYALEQRVRTTATRSKGWQAVSWPTTSEGIQRALERHVFERVSTKRYTGRRQAEYFDSRESPQRPIEYPIYEVGHLYVVPEGMDLDDLP